jgi:hypothetical protein
MNLEIWLVTSLGAGVAAIACCGAIVSPAEASTIRPVRILKSLTHIHHVAIAVLLFLACDNAISIALSCYGLIALIVVVALRATTARNAAYMQTSIHR